FHQRRDLSFPDREWCLASIPVRQPANPLRDDHAIVIELFGHRNGAAVGFDALGFVQNNERAGADFFQRGGFGENWAIYDLRFTIYGLLWGFGALVIRKSYIVNFAQWFLTERRDRLPFTATVEHFTSEPSDMTRAFSIGLQPARHFRMFQ